MATRPLQPALRPRSDLDPSVAPQKSFLGNSRVVSCSCLPATAGCPRQVDLWEWSWKGTSRGALHSRLTVWWNDRQQKKGSRLPAIRHRESPGVPWLDNVWKLASVDGQLAGMDKQQGSSPSSNSTSPKDVSPPRSAGCRSDVTAAEVSKLCHKEQLGEAVDGLAALVQGGSRVSTSLFYSVLRGCVAQKNLALGRRVHELATEVGYDSNTFLGNHFLRMYASHGRLQEAKDVFTRVAKPDAFSWSAAIAAHAKHGEPEQAVKLYQELRSSSVKPDNHVFVAALQACASAADLGSGRRVHRDVLESGIQPNLFVWNCLLDMYAKCGRLEDARKIFDSLVRKDVVTWNAMIAGYAEHEQGQEALSLHEQMEVEGVVLADPFTFACLLNASAKIGALQQGKQLHSQILERGLEFDIVVGNCLVDMYSKFGRLEDAWSVFDSMPVKDVVTWTTMIDGFGQINEGHKAIQWFEDMRKNGVQANETTFTCLLVACSHEGLVKEGQRLFKGMVEEHGIRPTVEHLTCMVDLLGRAGYLDEAEEMLLSFQSNDVGLMALLNACRSHGDLERGARCFESLIKSDSQNAGAYVLMANMYADAGSWSGVHRVERLRKAAQARKKPAVAGIEVGRHVHTFVVGEEAEDISSKVGSVNTRLKQEGGHVPHTELVLKQLPQKGKEDSLCGHAEKLALAFGLMNTPEGTPLLVTKNLRMCGDCHSSTEIMSRIEKREITVRDSHRIHRFVNGSCYCGGRP